MSTEAIDVVKIIISLVRCILVIVPNFPESMKSESLQDHGPG